MEVSQEEIDSAYNEGRAMAIAIHVLIGEHHTGTQMIALAIASGMMFSKFKDNGGEAKDVFDQIIDEVRRQNK